MRRKAKMEHKGITALDDLEMLLPAVIFGAEDSGEGDDSNSDNDGDGSDDAGSDDDQNQDDQDKDDTSGLKSALAKERARANKAEKALKARQKAEEDAALAEKSEVEQANAKAAAAAERAEKLAAGLLRREINSAIEKAARDAKFLDVSDAIDGVDRNALVYEQDQDDPDDITIDLKSVERAVKALATKKPHFLARGTDDGEPTGGQFGRGKGGRKPDQDEALKDKYPSLR